MNVQMPPSLLRVTDTRLLVDAVYYVVRVLRNATRGYNKTAVSTEPTPAARRLAQRALKEIETAEKEKIIHLDDNRIGEYITVLQASVTSTYSMEIGANADDAEKILNEMRGRRI